MQPVTATVSTWQTNEYTANSSSRQHIISQSRSPDWRNPDEQDMNDSHIYYLSQFGSYDKALPPIPSKPLATTTLLPWVGSIHQLQEQTAKLAHLLPSTPVTQSKAHLTAATKVNEPKAKAPKIKNGSMLISLPLSRSSSTQALSELQDIHQLLRSVDSASISPTRKALQEQEEKQSLFDYQAIDTMISLTKLNQMSEDALYLMLDMYEKQEKLKVIVTQVCSALEKLDESGAIFFRFLERSAALTEKTTPFRLESPGVSIFCHLLQQALEKQLGLLAFASLAYELIRKMMPVSKKADSGSSTPDRQAVETLTKSYIEKLGVLFINRVYAKSALIQKQCQSFLQITQAKNYTLIKPRQLLLSVLFLRCITPELTKVVAKLRESSQSNHSQIADLMMALSKSLTAHVRDSSEQPDQGLKLIITSLLPPTEGTFEEIATFIAGVTI